MPRPLCSCLHKLRVFSGSTSEAEGLARVAALAGREVVAAEGAPVVVAGHAALPAPRAEVLGGARRVDLLRARDAGADLVAVVAAQALARAVFGVAEVDAVGRRVGGDAPVAAELVAGAAGADVAPPGLRVLGVGPGAGVVR